MKINFTSSANNSFEDEVDFIFKKWNVIEVEKFINLVDDFTKKLSENPCLGKKSEKKDIRVFVLSKQTTVIYRVKEELKEIDLIFFWNNKRNLKDLEKYLK
jgi:plasmid stabilization system protein ParE